MTTFATLSKSSVPRLSTPQHHLDAVKEIKAINEIIEKAGLDEKMSTELVNSISSLVKVCVSDTEDRFE